jgi:hypothetical protein
VNWVDVTGLVVESFTLGVSFGAIIAGSIRFGVVWDDYGNSSFLFQWSYTAGPQWQAGVEFSYSEDNQKETIFEVPGVDVIVAAGAGPVSGSCTVEEFSEWANGRGFPNGSASVGPNDARTVWRIAREGAYDILKGPAVGGGISTGWEGSHLVGNGRDGEVDQ